MDKDIIPLEEAKELKALGYDGDEYGYYYRGKPVRYGIHGFKLRSNCKYPTKDRHPAPMFQQVFRWFREKHKLDTYVARMPPEVYGKGKGPIKNYLQYIWGEHLEPRGQDTSYHDTYEEAELECLRRLIEIVKQKSNG
jgi:hypothetical protein